MTNLKYSTNLRPGQLKFEMQKQERKKERFVERKLQLSERLAYSIGCLIIATGLMLNLMCHV